MTQNEKKLKELLLKNEALDREVSGLLKEETLQKVAAYSQDKGNFSDEEWDTLEKERKDFEVKLRRELDQVQNIKEKEKKQKERNVAPTWLFVR